MNGKRGNMRTDFVLFMNNIKKDIAKGTIKLSEPITDYDLAVQYAIGQIGERKKYPFDVTLEEIFEEMTKFAPELLED